MTYLLAGGRRVRAHPAADVFPLLSKDEITALAADIRTNGQRLPVLLQQADDGADLVLDGRNRLLACDEAGLEPRVAYVEPTADAVQVIVSTNLARRHQGESQRAMSAARLVHLVRGRPEQIASIDAISQGSAAGLLHLGRATVQRAVAILHDPLLAPAVDAGKVAVSDAYAIRHAAEEAKRRALAAVADGSARTLRGALERESAGPATVGLGSTAPAADRATGRSEPSRGVGDAKTVMASAAAASSDGGSGSPSEREGVETSTAGATDSEAHRPVASEARGTEAADPAGGWTRSDSASSSDSGSSGSTPTAVQDRELGGAEASPDPAPLLPARAAVGGREAAAAHEQGVHAATAAQTASDADAERRRCLRHCDLRRYVLGQSAGRHTIGFEAACRLVRIWWWRWSGVWRQVWMSGAAAPADLFRSLEARLRTVGHAPRDTGATPMAAAQRPSNNQQPARLAEEVQFEPLPSAVSSDRGSAADR